MSAAETAGDVAELVARWSAAESDYDAETLAVLLDDDFRGIGPLGFVLDRAAWVRRFDDGLRYLRAQVDDLEVREHGPVAVVVGVWDQIAEYQGRPTPGRFRIGLVAHRGAGPSARGWTILELQLSGPVPGAPGPPGQAGQEPGGSRRA